MRDGSEKHNWATFAQEFMDSFCDDFPRDLRAKAPPGCEWSIGPTFARMDTDFRRAEAPFVAEIERVICAMCNPSGEALLPETSAEVAYFLALRGQVVSGFLLKLEVETSPKSTALSDSGAGGADILLTTLTIIPFPAKPAHEVMQWLLITWWREHGPWQACLDRLTEAVPLEDEHGQV